VRFLGVCFFGFQEGKRGGGDLGGLLCFSSGSYKNAIYFVVRRKDCCDFVLWYHYIELTNGL